MVVKHAWLLLVALVACAPSRPSSMIVSDTTGQAIDLRAEASRASFTVVTFFSAHCPCQRAHDERMHALYTDFAPRGVEFLAVDAEAGASPERARTEHDARRYPYPILVASDPNRRVADDAI